MKKENLYGRLIFRHVFAGDDVRACSYRFYCRRDMKDFFVRCLRVEGRICLGRRWFSWNASEWRETLNVGSTMPNY